VPAGQKEAIFNGLQELYEQNVGDPTIKISKIAVMERPGTSKHWRIRNEFDFG
jgi:hypothetical protein